MTQTEYENKKAKSERGFSELCYYAPAAFKQCPYYQPKKMKDGK